MRSAVVSLFAVLLGACPCFGEPSATGVKRLEFRSEVQNIRAVDGALARDAAPGITLSCAEISGQVGYGKVPHRQHGERAASAEHFVHFAVAYPATSSPVLLFDADGDRTLTCAERIPLLGHPQDPSLMFRTVTVSWKDDGGVPRTQRYRITVPAHLDLSAATGARLFVDLVDVPVARWSVGGRDSLWILFDGNFNGEFDRGFGDGLLIDQTGERRIDMRPKGQNFFSYHAPLELPWGNFEVTEVDPKGRSITLAPASEAKVREFRPFHSGEVVPALECRSGAGSPVAIAGPSGRWQLLFFWLSGCASCKAEMQELTPLVAGIGPERLSAVGISLDEDPVTYLGFVDSIAAGWSHCYSGRMLWDNAMARRFGVYAPSEFVLLDPEGRLVAHGHGAQGAKEAIEAASLKAASLKR